MQRPQHYRRERVLIGFAFACGLLGGAGTSSGCSEPEAVQNVEPAKSPKAKADAKSNDPSANDGKASAPAGAQPAEPAQARIPMGHVDSTDALLLGRMYWVGSRYLLGRDHGLVVTGTVREMATMKPDNPSLRGRQWTVEARIEVHTIFVDSKRPPVAPKFVVSELASGLHVGDKVIVFGTKYEGSYGQIEALGSNSRLGIKIEDWSDPIVATLPAVLSGTADFNDKAIADVWRPFGAPAIQCLIDDVPPGMCD